MTNPAPQSKSAVRRARQWWDHHLPRIVTALLAALLMVTLAGSLFPAIGDWLQSVRYASTAVMIGVALLFVELLTAERQETQEQSVYEDSLKLSTVFAEAANSRSVSIDFAGDSAETFKLLLRETLRRIPLARPRPQSIHVRI